MKSNLTAVAAAAALLALSGSAQAASRGKAPPKSPAVQAAYGAPPVTAFQVRNAGSQSR